MYMFSTNKLKELYGKLQDDESRSIFNARLRYFLDGDDENIWKLSDKIYERGYFNKEISELIELKHSGFEIALYGAGTVGEAAKGYFERNGLIVDFFCDKNPDKQKCGYMNLPVISLQMLTEKRKNVAVVITTSSVWAEDIRRELKNHNFNDRIYDFFINYEILGYFSHDLFKPLENEIYIDCGTLNGGTIKEFSDFTKGNYQKIYGFEPDKVSFKRTLEYIREQKLEKVEIINKGVWSENTMLSFSAQSDGGSHITDCGSGTTTTILVTAIDDIVGDDAVTFIKMDIEGAELEALRGAERTIRLQKPRLAICVYHKPEDIVEIPLYIQSLVPKYKYYLRHNTIGKSGTLLYAVKE